MILQEVCPKCGSDLLHIELASNPPIPKWVCPRCNWSFTGQRKEVIRVPFVEYREMESE